jgi:septum formation protein
MDLKLPPLILASASPRRDQLLRELELNFKPVTSPATELKNEQLTAIELSQLNAYRKARAVSKRFPDMLVIGADTVVYLDTTAYGKPRSMEEAAEMLGRLQGRSHQVVTGVCLVHLRRHRQRLFFDSTFVTFRPLNASEIRRYLEAVEPFDKAGAYAIQEQGDQLVESIEGSYSNVVGLPLERLKRELAAFQLE